MTVPSQSWRTVKLKEVSEYVTVGHVGPMVDEYREEGVPFLRSQNVRPFHLDLSEVKYIGSEFHGKLTKSELRPGDVVIVRTGYPGTACVMPEGLPVANCADLVIVRPSDALDGRFLAAVFNSAWGRSRVFGSLVGVAQQHFNVGVAKEMELHLPPLSAQKSIGDVLGRYGDLIENNARRIEVLEEVAQAIYREWFKNYHFPGHEAVEMAESELGPIPAGWAAWPLMDVADVTYGFPFKSKLFNQDADGLPVVRIRDILAGQSSTFTTEEADDKYVIRDGDILVGMDGTFHRGKWSSGAAYLNQRVARFRPREGLSRGFLYLALKDPIEFLNATISGTTVAHLSDRRLRDVRLCIPSRDVLNLANDVLEPLFELEITLSKANSVLRETRDLLLPKLVSGEISVEGFDSSLEEAVA